jgi:hypothetical protein
MCAQGGLTAQPLRVVTGGDEQQGGSIRADAVKAEQARCAGGDQRDDQLVQAGGLVLEELHAPEVASVTSGPRRGSISSTLLIRQGALSSCASAGLIVLR